MLQLEAPIIRIEKQQLKINKDSQILIIGSEGVTDRDIYNKFVTNELLSET